jgi:hypothetical protein
MSLPPLQDQFDLYAPLMTIENALTPVELRERCRTLCFSGLYAFYTKRGSIPEVSDAYLDLTHQSEGTDWLLL